VTDGEFVVSLMTGVRKVGGTIHHAHFGERFAAAHPLVKAVPEAFAPDGLTRIELGQAELAWLRWKDAADPVRHPVARAFRKAAARAWPRGSDSTKLGHEPRNRKARAWTGGPGAESLPADDPEQA
jgi:hypothetical protein